MAEQAETPPAVVVESPQDAPVPVIDERALNTLGQNLNGQFMKYRSDRVLSEEKWMKSLRQYLGQYDPDVEKQLKTNRSRAYPRLTRVKCISMLSRIMNLMFPGNEPHWTLKASPNADMALPDLMAAVEKAQEANQAAGITTPMTDDDINAAVQELANKRAEQLSEVINDQLQEIGGDQTLDFIAMNRQVLKSGIMYGVGVMRGPFVREVQSTRWGNDPVTGGLVPIPVTMYKPIFEFLPVWDFYPDMSAKTLAQGDGYFTRMVMSTSQVNALKLRPDFMQGQIAKYMNLNPQGNYKEQTFEAELRSMATKATVADVNSSRPKYEIIVWNGSLSGHQLAEVGVQVPQDKLGLDLDAEVWILDSTVIKAAMNPWRRLGVSMKTIHTFIFDEDDTSPVGNGLPNIMRDSQMSICAGARMLLDNASITCGPMVEIDLDRLVQGQNITQMEPFKFLYTENNPVGSMNPVMKSVQVESRMDDLLKVIDTFNRFADMETFVGPATGGDMDKTPSEPMRTAVGQSMMRGDTALPFKDIIRNHDSFTQSAIQSLVEFNRKLNPTLAPEGDYNVIARGATSLIAKEIRGMQLDQLAATITPAESVHINARKLIEARVKSRDLDDLLVPEAEAARIQQTQQGKSDEAEALQQELLEATIRKTLSDALKNVAQAQKNSANADGAAITSVLDLMQAALGGGEETSESEAGKSTPQLPPGLLDGPGLPPRLTAMAGGMA